MSRIQQLARKMRAERETGDLLKGIASGMQAQQTINAQLAKQKASADKPSIGEQMIQAAIIQNNPEIAKAMGLRMLAGVGGTQQQGAIASQQGVGGLVNTKVTGGGVTMEDPQAQAQVAGAKAAATKGQGGLSAEAAGRLTMVQQAKTDLDDLENMLFDDEGNLDRGLAIRSNIPLSDAPVIGGMIPDAIGGDARMVMSRLENAIQAKLRTETGAQANDQEVRKLYKTFGIDGFFDSSKSAKDRITRLKEFMDNASITIDPSGNFIYRTGDRNLDTQLNSQSEPVQNDSIISGMGLDPNKWEIVDG